MAQRTLWRKRCRMCGEMTVDFETCPAFGTTKDWAICYRCWLDYSRSPALIALFVPPAYNDRRKMCSIIAGMHCSEREHTDFCTSRSMGPISCREARDARWPLSGSLR